MSDDGNTAGLRKHAGYQGLLLAGFATLAAALLAGGNSVTEAPIAQRRQEDLMASLNQVIPASRYDQNLLSHSMTMLDDQHQRVKVYRAIKQGRVNGVAFEQTGQGYGGAIRVLLGVDPQGRLLGVRVLSHSETPGLGDKIEADRDDWIFAFDGLSLSNPPRDRWAVRKDGGHFDQFTGATISPRAVVNAVRQGLQLFEDNRSHLLTLSNPVATVAEKQP